MPQAEFSVSWLTPGVRPPSPSKANTLTDPAPPRFSASASPAAAGLPCAEGPVLNFRNSVLPAISACPESPPRRRNANKCSQPRARFSASAI